VLLEAGLAARRDDGTVISRFRSRLLFPIHDLRGRAVGFGGRLLGPGEPKYLNSPENAIFHKGRQLYNLHQAKGPIRMEETVILVEGYFDVLRLVLAGVDHVVAPLGTALTPDQATLLRRFAPAAVLLYDSDQAGLRATFRAGDELLRHGVRVRVATMPAGEDPDTLVRRGGAAALEPLVRDAMDLLERKLQLLEQKGWFEGVDHQRDALDRLLPTIRAAADPIMRDLYLKEVSERTGVSREVLLQQVLAQPERRSDSRPPAPPDAPADGNGSSRKAKPDRVKVDVNEKELLAILVQHPSWIARAMSEVPLEWVESPILRELYDAMRTSPDEVGTAGFLERLSETGQRAWRKLSAVEAKYGTTDPDQTYVACCQALEVRPLQRELDALEARRKAGVPSDQYDELIQHIKRIEKEIASRSPTERLKRYHRRAKRDAR
jgi:DNA primase